MRYIGLDLGTTTCGVAITDKTNTLVSPLKLIKFAREDYEAALKEVLVIIKEKNVDVVVLGLPKNMDNTMGFAADRSLNFKKMLEENNIKVELQDERLTSVEAINIMKNNGLKQINKKGKTDIISATLILESYLKKVSYGK
mgnify:CR=1 FL=1